MGAPKKLVNHENHCRLCLRPSKARLKLSKMIQKKFLEVTQTELPILDKLSNFLCPNCFKRIKATHSYRLKLIETQQELMKTISVEFCPVLINLKQEKIDIDEIVSEIEVKQEHPLELDGDQNLLCLEGFPFEDMLNFDDEDEKPKSEVFDDDYAKSEDSDDENSDDADSEATAKKKPKTPGTKRIRKRKIESFKCEFEDCGLIVETKRKFNEHAKIHKEKKKRKWRKKTKSICSYCGVLLSSKNAVATHIELVHLKSKNVFCDVCGYGAALKYQMISHMRSHLDKSERRKYTCDRCDFVTLTALTLRRHIMHDHDGYTISCTCGKAFRHKAALQTHINTVHLKIKNHVCDCGKKYYSKKDLVDHKKMSHTENPVYEHSCELCGKAFCTRKQLNRHKFNHQEATFKCDHYGCDKCYITRQKLQRHLKTHVGERDLLCHLCDKAYFFQKDLQRHLDVAHKQTTYFCELCSFTNSRKDYLGNHIRSAHPQVEQTDRYKMIARAKFIKNSV